MSSIHLCVLMKKYLLLIEQEVRPTLSQHDKNILLPQTMGSKHLLLGIRERGGYILSIAKLQAKSHISKTCPWDVHSPFLTMVMAITITNGACKVGYGCLRMAMAQPFLHLIYSNYHVFNLVKTVES